MDDENKPTELTVEDIDKVLLSWEEMANAEMKMTHCTSCDKELAYILTDYYTGQCQECFYARKPWLSTSPVRDAFWVSLND